MLPDPLTPHLSDEELLLDFYGEGTPAERDRVRTHLERCALCRALDEELRGVLTAVETTPVVEPPSDFEREMWARIEPLLPVPPARRGWWSGAVPRFAIAASVAALLVAAFAAGRLWDRPAARSVTPETVEPARTERLLRAEVEDHLERSQRMLVELVNADARAAGSIGTGHARAADLVAAGRLYRRSAEAVGDREIGRLLEDLERVLVEVANEPPDASPENLARVRQRIDDQDLVFRLRVVARELRERQDGGMGW